MRRRCGWARDPLDVQHHDEEWGVPEHDDRRLFEFLILEGAQAGLSWLTILRKRDAYRRAFAGFDVERMARFSDSDVRRLLGDAGIVRNRAKIEAAIGNARGCRTIQREHGSFASYVWRSKTPGHRSARYRQKQTSPEPSAATWESAVSASSAQPSATPSCSLSGW